MEPEESPQWQKNLSISLGILLFGAVLITALMPGGGILLAPYVLFAGIGIFGLWALIIAVGNLHRQLVRRFQIEGRPPARRCGGWLWATGIGFFACNRIPWYVNTMPANLRLGGVADLLFGALLALPVAGVLYLLAHLWSSSRD